MGYSQVTVSIMGSNRSISIVIKKFNSFYSCMCLRLLLHATSCPMAEWDWITSCCCGLRILSCGGWTIVCLWWMFINVFVAISVVVVSVD